MSQMQSQSKAPPGKKKRSTTLEKAEGFGFQDDFLFAEINKSEKVNGI